MMRGRRENRNAPPSRGLEISRAFRERRAQEVRDLRAEVSRLSKENVELRNQLSDIIPARHHAVDALTNGAPSPNDANSSRKNEDSSPRQICKQGLLVQEGLSHLMEAARYIEDKAESLLLPLNSSMQIEPEIQAQRPPERVRVPLAPSGVFESWSRRDEPREEYRQSDKSSCRLAHGKSSSHSTKCPDPSHKQVAISPSVQPPEEHVEFNDVWAQSLEDVGGDSSKCCAGFFDCNVEGIIVVPSPPRGR